MSTRVFTTATQTLSVSSASYEVPSLHRRPAILQTALVLSCKEKSLWVKRRIILGVAVVPKALRGARSQVTMNFLNPSLKRWDHCYTTNVPSLSWRCCQDLGW